MPRQLLVHLCLELFVLLEREGERERERGFSGFRQLGGCLFPLILSFLNFFGKFGGVMGSLQGRKLKKCSFLSIGFVFLVNPAERQHRNSQSPPEYAEVHSRNPPLGACSCRGVLMGS
jgi:hypothetical protein